MVHYGNHAEKRNLIDVFFNQDRGILVILGLIPITFISWYMGDFFLSLPSIPYPTIEGTWPTVAWNIGLVAASRFGGFIGSAMVEPYLMMINRNGIRFLQ